MTTTTSALPDLLDALQDALASRPGLADVAVLSGPADADDLGKEYVTLALLNPPVALPQRYAGMNVQYKKEDLRIRCECRANQPGKGEDNLRLARRRVFAIFGEVEDELRTNPTLGLPAVDVAQVEDAEFQQGADDQGRIAVIEFSIIATTSLIS